MRLRGNDRRLYEKIAILSLCLLFLLLPDVRFAGTGGNASDTDLRHSGYHQQHQYAPLAVSHDTPAPDGSAWRWELGFAAAALAVSLHALHAKSRIPILCKHRMLRPLKFRCSFLTLFRFAI